MPAEIVEPGVQFGLCQPPVAVEDRRHEIGRLDPAFASMVIARQPRQLGVDVVDEGRDVARQRSTHRTVIVSTQPVDAQCRRQVSD